MFKKQSALIKLTLKVFFGQPVGFVMGVIAPVIIMIILPYLFNGIQNIGNHVMPLKSTLAQIVPGVLLIPTLLIGFLGIPLTLATLKSTTLLKKIRMTNVSAFSFMASFIIAFLLIIFTSTLVLFTLSKAIWQNDSPNPAGIAFLIPWLLLIIVTISFGITIGNFAKNVMTAFAIGIASFLPIMFLSGVMFAEMQGWIERFAKIVPHNHLVNLFKVSFFENDLNIHNYHLHVMPKSIEKSIDISLTGKTGDTLLAYLYPLAIFTLQSVVNIKKFHWE